MNNKTTGYEIRQDLLDPKFPTQMHSSEFWESLGRTVATFSMLEDVLGKAIFSFEATTPYDGSDINEAYQKWISKLAECLNGQLRPLIKRYEKAVKKHPESTTQNLENVVSELKKISQYRNALCHGSWVTPPDSNGATIPFFIDFQKKQFATPIDVDFLGRIQTHTADLICIIINSVTILGWQFPGSNGPGEAIMKTQKEA